MDIGQCSDEPCSQSSSFSDTCGAREDCCCSPMGDEHQEKIVVSCGGGYQDVVFNRVSECGCSTCDKRETVIKGEPFPVFTNVTVLGCLVYYGIKGKLSRGF